MSVCLSGRREPRPEVQRSHADFSDLATDGPEGPVERQAGQDVVASTRANQPPGQLRSRPNDPDASLGVTPSCACGERAAEYRDDPNVDPFLDAPDCVCAELGCDGRPVRTAVEPSLSAARMATAIADACRSGVHVSGLPAETAAELRDQLFERRVLVEVIEGFRVAGLTRSLDEAKRELAVWDSEREAALAHAASRPRTVEVPLAVPEQVGGSGAWGPACCGDPDVAGAGPLRSRWVGPGVWDVELVLLDGVREVTVGPVRVDVSAV